MGAEPHRSRDRDADAGVAADGEDRQADLGILFVHGIGEQPRGDTLVRFGEPLLSWLQRWLGRRGSVRLDEAFVAGASSGPAHLIASIDPGRASDADDALRAMLATANLETVGVRAGDEPSESRRTDPAASPPEVSRGGRPQRWLVAESWWAPHFRRPPFGKLAAWLLSRGPWVIVSRHGERIRRARGWRRAVTLAGFLVAILVALWAQIVVGILAILALVPWPRFRDALSGLLLTLTGTLGDSYVLIESPVQESAAVTQVRDDLEWMTKRSRRVAVVAHSQGTAIARRALEPPGTPISLFITMGQGLRRLEELRQMTGKWEGMTSALGFLLPVVAATALLGLFPPPGLSGDDVGFFRWALIGYPAILLVMSLMSQPDYEQEIARLRIGDRARWVDFYASADLVAGGPLDVEGVVSREVHNRGSVISDHTAYWENRDQVVGPVLTEIDRAAKSGLFGDSGRALVEGIGSLRPRRVGVLLWLRRACFLSVPVAVYALRADLGAVGSQVLGPLAGIPLIGELAEALLGAGGAVERLAGLADPTGHAAVGALIVGLLALVWYKLTARLWRTWDDLAIRPIFQKVTPGDHNEQRIVGWIVGLVGVAPLVAASAVLLLGRSLDDVLMVSWVVAWIGPGALVALGVVLLVGFAIFGKKKA